MAMQEIKYRLHAQQQYKVRVTRGIQCPECSGVMIKNRDDHCGKLIGWECIECGCNWSSDYFCA